jgi:hypothetical protein
VAQNPILASPVDLLQRNDESIEETYDKSLPRVLVTKSSTSVEPTVVPLEVVTNEGSGPSKVSPTLNVSPTSNIAHEAIPDNITSPTLPTADEEFAWTLGGELATIHLKRINHSSFAEIHKVCYLLRSRSNFADAEYTYR